MASQLDIVNDALGHLGQEPLNDLTAGSLDTSTAAKKILRHLDSARRSVVSRGGWTSHRAYTTLQAATIAGYVNFRLPGVFSQPGDLLRIWAISGSDWTLDAWTWPSWSPDLPLPTTSSVGQITWESGTELVNGAVIRVLRANVTDQLQIAYIADRPYEALSQPLADAITYDVAYRACEGVTADDRLKKALDDKRAESILSAAAFDATQEDPGPLIPARTAVLRQSCA